MELPKIVAIGIYDSSIIKPNVAISKSRKVSMFEIELPIDNGGISYVDSVSKPIRTNMIICAKPGQIRHTKFPYKCYYIHMIVPPGELYDILTETPVFFQTTKADIYKLLFSAMISHYNAFSQKEDIMIQSKVLELIYTISTDKEIRFKNNKSNSNSLIIEKTLNYIDEHLTEELTLENMAEQNLLSPIYFHNIFKTATGKTLRTYVEEQRIKKATNLLLTTNYTLTQIAYECGFSSQSYFSYVFKRKMNCTPREYIKEIYKNYEI